MSVISHCAYVRDIKRNVEAVLLHCIVLELYGPKQRPNSSLRDIQVIL